MASSCCFVTIVVVNCHNRNKEVIPLQLWQRSILSLSFSPTSVSESLIYQGSLRHPPAQETIATLPSLACSVKPGVWCRMIGAVFIDEQLLRHCRPQRATAPRSNGMGVSISASQICGISELGYFTLSLILPEIGVRTEWGNVYSWRKNVEKHKVAMCI